MPLRYGYFALCLLRYAFLHYAFLRYASLRYSSLRYGYLRYSFLGDGHLQNRLVAIQLWIDAFMIWTIWFQIVIIEFCHRYTSIEVQEKHFEERAVKMGSWLVKVPVKVHRGIEIVGYDLPAGNLKSKTVNG